MIEIPLGVQQRQSLWIFGSDSPSLCLPYTKHCETHLLQGFDCRLTAATCCVSDVYSTLNTCQCIQVADLQGMLRKKLQVMQLVDETNCRTRGQGPHLDTCLHQNLQISRQLQPMAPE